MTHIRKNAVWLTLGVALFVGLLTAGCGHPSPGRSHSSMSMSAGGRSVKVEADVSNSWSTINNDRAEIVLDNQKLVVEFANDQITLDGKKYVQLPSGTKQIDIQLTSGTFTILADGTEVKHSVEAEKSE